MPCPRLRIPFLLALLGLAVGVSRAAAWGDDPYLGAVPVCTANGGQYGSVACSDGSGGMIVAWYDGRGASQDIYVQRIDATGLARWTANGVNLCNAASSQTQPVIASDGAGGAIVAWLDSRNSGTTGVDVYANRVNSNGGVQWGATGIVVCNATTDQDMITLCTDNLGGAYVAWFDKRANQEIFLQRFNASGTALFTANGFSISGANNVKATPKLVNDGGSGAICAWMDGRNSDADIYANRVNSVGSPLWGASGVSVCTTTGAQNAPVLVADGSGGAIIGWMDARVVGEIDVYARHMRSTGIGDGGATGIAVCSVVGLAYDAVVTSDGAGGAIFAWRDARSATARCYARRFTAENAAVWTIDGVDMSGGLSSATAPRLVSDGLGGAIVAWGDGRFGPTDLFAQRVNELGTRLWKSGGEPVTLAENDQINMAALLSDNRGGALVAWDDQHFSDDIFAQRISHGGAIADPWPVITRVRDALGDQGGAVVIEWTASYLDAPPTPLSGYSIWRRAPSGVMATRGARPLRVTGPTTSQAVFWEYVTTVPARARAGYSYVAATTTDSLSPSSPRTSFMVSAEMTGSSTYYDSAPDSGRSVDNLAPALPQAFSAQYAPGGTALHWARNNEADLAGYRLYRGSSAGFTPDANSLVNVAADTGYVDMIGAPYFYKLTAVDIHGNESPVALTQPTGTTDVAGTARARTFLAPLAPSPLARGARGVLRFGLARGGAATLTLHDAQGRRVRTLSSGPLEAGEHRVMLETADIAPGLYLARLEATGVRMTQRVVVVQR